jgi:hypothetical protein
MGQHFLGLPQAANRLATPLNSVKVFQVQFKLQLMCMYRLQLKLIDPNLTVYKLFQLKLQLTGITLGISWDGRPSLGSRAETRSMRRDAVLTMATVCVLKCYRNTNRLCNKILSGAAETNICASPQLYED